jgi:hypothetical protein
MYALLTPTQVLAHQQAMIREGVSEVARAPGGFMHTYLRDGVYMLSKSSNATGLTWAKKRDAFIKRHLAQYKSNPTPRRRLALIAWAYMP